MAGTSPAMTKMRETWMAGTSPAMTKMKEIKG
jgi:hypothetical protein